MLIERARTAAFWALAASMVAVSFSNSLFEIASGLYLGFSLAALVLDKRWETFKSRVAFFAGLYLLATLLSVFGSAYLDNSAKGLFRVLRCVMMALFAPAVVDSEKKLKTIFYVTAVSALLVGVDALLQGWLGFDLIRGRGMTPYSSESARVTGPFHHANDFSAYLSLTLFLFLGMLGPAFAKKKLGQGFFFALGAAVLGACLLWTYARGAWLAVAASFLLMALVKKNRFLLIGLVLFLAGLFLFSSPDLKGRVESLWNRKDGTITERRLLWKESLDMLSQRPWFGWGINTYSKVEPEFKSKTVHTDYQYAHNGYLQIAAETGFVGLAAFLTFLAYFFVQGSQVRGGFAADAASALLFGIFAFLLHSATDTDLQSLRLVSFLWLSMGLVLAAKKMTERVS